MRVKSIVAATAMAVVAATGLGLAQRGATMAPDQAARRWETEKELQSIAVVERKVMMPMRDGVRLATDIYRPKNATAPVPTIWCARPTTSTSGTSATACRRDMSAALTAVKRGYAYVVQNERGHFYSEGNYDILGSKTDGYDALEWLSKQKWSNGKVGTTGCSSTAEYQMAVASLGHPAYAAMNVQGFGAGVGRVAPYFEQGNWYRGGAVQMLFITWIYGQQNQVRPMFPKDTPQEDLVRAAAAVRPRAAESRPSTGARRCAHLPVQDIIKNVEGPKGIFADAMPVDTGGRMIQRAPNDPAWYKGGLYHDDMPLEVPGLWFMSWYDVSVGPNLALYNHVRKTAKPEIASQQWAVIAPVAHCAYTRATENTVVGERSMGDARLDYAEMIYGFFDRTLKGAKSAALDALPKVTLLHDGRQQVADVGDVAAGGSQADDVLPLERRQGQHALRRRPADDRAAANRCAGCVHLRSDEPGDVVRRQRLLHRQRDYRRRLRPAQDGGAAGHPRLHLGAVQGRTRDHRRDGADALRLVRRPRYRLHGQGPRRLPGRPRLQPRRVDPADALPRRLRQAAGVDGTW